MDTEPVRIDDPNFVVEDPDHQTKVWDDCDLRHEVIRELQLKEVLGFFDEYSFLSNFFPCKVIYNDLEFPSSEHAYMYNKMEPGTDSNLIAYKLMKEFRPGQAKRWGRQITLRSDWEDVKLRIMEEIVDAKFRQNPTLRVRLIDLDGCYLEETNSWGDKFWGVCRGEGKNHLGKILMRVRDRLLLEQQFSSERIEDALLSTGIDVVLSSR